MFHDWFNLFRLTEYDTLLLNYESQFTIYFSPKSNLLNILFLKRNCKYLFKIELFWIWLTWSQYFPCAFCSVAMPQHVPLSLPIPIPLNVKCIWIQKMFLYSLGLFIYLFIYWARIKKDIHDRWCEKKWEINYSLGIQYCL